MAIFNSYFDRLPEGICTNLANFAIQCETPWCERTSRAWWSIDHPLKHCSLSKHHRWFRRKWVDSWRWFRNTVWRLQNSRRTIRGRQRRFRRLRPHRGNSRRRFRQLSWRHQLRCPRWPRHLTLRLSHASLIKRRPAPSASIDCSLGASVGVGAGMHKDNKGPHKLVSQPQQPGSLHSNPPS
jgi:hypothetical protein